MTNSNTQIASLATKITSIMGGDATDPTVIKIAKGWIKFTELGVSKGMTFEEADAFTYKMFKQDTDNFATFCTLVSL